MWERGVDRCECGGDGGCRNGSSGRNKDGNGDDDGGGVLMVAGMLMAMVNI